MSVVVLGAGAVAAEFAAAAVTIRDGVTDVSMGAARSITDEWQGGLPGSPGGYQGAGFTSSPGANQARPLSDGPLVGAEAYNQSFVASFLQNGTAHHGPKYDLIGAADPHIDKWLEDVAEKAGL